MIGTLLLIFLTAFAVLALTKGEINITRDRKVDATTSKFIGWILVAGVVGTFLLGSLIGIGALLLAILLGLLNSESTVNQP